MWVTNKFWGILIVTVVAFQGWLCYGCRSQERIALLQLKSHFPSSNKIFSSWGLDADCCSWKGVHCNPTTNRVSDLDLYGDYSYDDEMGRAWYLNASLFLPFHGLTYLDLSFNNIAGCVENGGFETLSKLKNLKYLELSQNDFNNSIVSSFGRLSLKLLDLSYNAIKGSINLTELNVLTDLVELDLSGNEINKFEPSEGAKGPGSLSVLFLDHLVNNVTDKLLESLGAFHNLKNLSLVDNKLRGAMFRHKRYNLIELSLSHCSLDEIFLQSLELLPSLKHLYIDQLQTGNLSTSRDLRELDMSGNNLIGSLPWCMSNLTSLQYLDLSNNSLSGDISFSPLKNMVSIESLILSDNHFQIPISLSPLFNYSKLKSFGASGNKVYNGIEIYNLIPKFQLKSLRLSCYGIGESIPQFFYHQHDLQEVDISNVRMRGRFPHWLLQNNTKLELLTLKNISLSGLLELPIQPHMNLRHLDVSFNTFYGQIPKKIGEHFFGLSSLNMSSNSFSGSIPSSMGNMSWLLVLDLSNNELSGTLPNFLIKGCRLLQELKLSTNFLRGQLFPRNASLTDLQWLQLDENEFTGRIPSSLSKSSNLRSLDLSINNLSGGIPRWITNMSRLELLDLCHNKIDGILMPNLFPSAMSQVYLSSNSLQGALVNGSDCKEMVAIDFSHNNLTGDIPKWLGRCSKLRFLVLRGNNFKGRIPKQLCKLDILNFVDLSSNYLSGPIPSCLSVKSNFSHEVEDLKFRSTGSENSRPIRLDFTVKSVLYAYVGKILRYLSGLDLSNNVLVGEIPLEFGNFDRTQVLNMSHNKLVGRVPQTFANLEQIESLDLSYNKLEGGIPLQLTKLHFLAVFSVAHNNLSGRTPDMTAQFATFDNRSYEGNPFLCGPPLSKSCDSTLSSDNSTNRKEKEDDGLIDMNVFYISFGVSFIMMLIGIFAVLWINPYWRQSWFYFVGNIMNNCFYFFVDNIPILSKYRFYIEF